MTYTCSRPAKMPLRCPKNEEFGVIIDINTNSAHAAYFVGKLNPAIELHPGLCAFKTTLRPNKTPLNPIAHELNARLLNQSPCETATLAIPTYISPVDSSSSRINAAKPRDPINGSKIAPFHRNEAML
jgi:hypothetical protein